MYFSRFAAHVLNVGNYFSRFQAYEYKGSNVFERINFYLAEQEVMYDEIILVLGGYTQVEIPVLNITDSITGEQIVSDFFIDWGDGTAVERIVSSTGDINASTRHTYADTSDKIVRMSGIVPCIDYKYYLYNFGGNPNSLKQILLFKNQHIRRVNFCFCRELTYVASKAFDIPSAQHIQELFYNCSKLEAIPGDLFYYNKQFNSDRKSVV